MNEKRRFDFQFLKPTLYDNNEKFNSKNVMRDRNRR